VEKRKLSAPFIHIPHIRLTLTNVT